MTRDGCHLTKHAETFPFLFFVFHGEIPQISRSVCAGFTFGVFYQHNSKRHEQIGCVPSVRHEDAEVKMIQPDSDVTVVASLPHKTKYVFLVLSVICAIRENVI